MEKIVCIKNLYNRIFPPFILLWNSCRCQDTLSMIQLVMKKGSFAKGIAELHIARSGARNNVSMILEDNSRLELPSGQKPLPLGSGYIASLLGSGAMANVYKIWNPQLETFRAVKLMKPNISAESRRRFQTEMKIMAALSHPNIIEIHSVGEWNGLSFIEMEYIEGFTLGDILEKKGAFPAAACTAVGIMVARALLYAHESDYALFGKSYHGIIHRDLKPSNLMVAKDGRVKLMDFGIARPVETSLMTLDGAVMGTMQYLAPEQIDGKNISVTADIYALGAVLYEMLTGCKAFPQKNLSQLMTAKMNNSYVQLRFFRLTIPARIKVLVSTCMEHDPKKRIHSASEVLKELDSIHRRLSPDSPEEIVRVLTRSSIREKLVLTARRPIPFKAAVGIYGVFLVAVAVSIVGLVSSRHDRLGATQSAPSAKDSAVNPIPSVGQSKESAASLVQAPLRADGVEKETASTQAAKKPAKSMSLVALTVPETRNKPIGTSSNVALKTERVTFEMFEKEMESANFENALQLFQKLPSKVAVQKNAQLLRLRALFNLGRMAEAGKIIHTQIIDDGEFFLIQAKYLNRQGDCDHSMKVLEKCLAVRARYLDADVIRRDYLYYRALCLSRRFDQQRSQENRKSALGAWFEVKNAVRNFPHHRYFNEAVSEMQRIGDEARLSSQVKKEAMR
jgi:serine/threonine protein kinase